MMKNIIFLEGHVCVLGLPYIYFVGYTTDLQQVDEVKIKFKPLLRLH